jgi:hypothetical protein
MNRNTKRGGILCHKLICFSQLYLELLDELDHTNPEITELANVIVEFLEKITNSIAETDTVLKTTYFNDISHKIDTILRKNFDPTM